MRAYRWLLRAFPPAFRARYGAEMESTLTLMLREARARGRGALTRAWIGAVADALSHSAYERRHARHTREARGAAMMMESLAIDLRQAVRSLISRPALTVPAILTIALAIGANAGIFGIVNAMLFRPLPYAQPDRLVLLWERFVPMGLDTMPWSIPDFIEVRDRSTQLSDVAIFRGDRVVRLDGGEPQRLAAISASANLFELLGVAPAAGRVYDANAGAREAVLAYATWRDRFGSNRDVIGRTLSFDTGPMVIVGVMPEGFQFPPPITFGDQMLTRDPDIYVPFDLEGGARGSHSHFAVGRMAAGATLASVRAELSSIAGGIVAANPEIGMSATDFGMHAVPLHGQSVSTVRRALIVVLAAVAAVLLIACASVANLLFAKAMARRHEMAMRTALGASRGRLIRQLFVESLVLGAAGGAAGLLAAPWISAGLLSVSPIDLQQMTDARIDGPVFIFAFAVTIAAVLLFGLIPALQGSRLDLTSALRSGVRVSATRADLRTKSLLVVGQVSIAMVLLVAAGLTAQSLRRLWEVNPGFTPEAVEVFHADLPASRYPDAASQIAFQQRLLDRLNAVPGIAAASAVSTLPFTFDRNSGNYLVEGEPPPDDGDFLLAFRNTASSRYFETLGIELQSGRPFRDSDTPDATPVAVVSSALAKRHWPNLDAVGRRLAFDPPAGEQPRWLTIVGVVDDVRMLGFDAPAEPTVYLPAAQSSPSGFWVAYRTTRAEGAVNADVRAAAAAIDGALPVGTIQTLTALMGDTVRKPRFTAVLLSAFGLTALLIAAVGLYGVMAFDVSRQTRDIGVRLALGATPGRMRWSVLGRGLRLSGIGLLIGLAAAYAAGRLMEDLLFGVSASDVATFAGTGALLVAVAAIASWLPAHRATRVDPMVALRSD